MICRERVSDPETGLPMSFCGTSRRRVKTPTKSYWLWIPIAVTSKGKYHRILPDFLLANKQYTVQTIESALDEDVDLDQYLLPSDSSVYRWNKWLSTLIEQLRIVLKLNDSADSLLHKLRVLFKRDVHKAIQFDSASGWLAKIANHHGVLSNDFDLGFF